MTYEYNELKKYHNLYKPQADDSLSKAYELFVTCVDISNLLGKPRFEDLKKVYFALSDTHEYQNQNRYKDYTPDDFITALEEEFSVYENPNYSKLIDIYQEQQDEINTRIEYIEINHPEALL